MIRKATNDVSIDDDSTLLDDFGGVRPVVSLGDRERWYDPAMDQFLTTDPVGHTDGPNWYCYASNDPCNDIDPTGLDVDALLAEIGIDPAEIEDLRRPYKGRGLDPALVQYCGRARWFNSEVGEFLRDE